MSGRKSWYNGSRKTFMMKPTTSLLAIRPTTILGAPPALRSLFVPRHYYSTQNSLGTTATPGPKRRTVTPFNDDGFVPWNELSAGEKAARATQQSFNFGMILVGLVLTVCCPHVLAFYNPNSIQGGVGYFLWHDVFSPDSKISQFNRAVDKIKDDPRCLELLGDPKKIRAHGEETFNKWRRARPVAYVQSCRPSMPI